VALGTLGVFAGLALVPRARGAAFLLGAAFIESGMAVAIVFGAAWFLLIAQSVPLTSPILLVALSLAAAAGASGASGLVEGPRREGDNAMHVADLDDVLPILVAAASVGFATPGTGPNAIVALIEPIAIGLASGTVGLLLFERTTGEAERAVYVLGVLALIGGDLRKFQHPLVVLLVVVAGAQALPGPLSVFLFAIFVVFRLSGKVIGGAAAAWLVPRVAGEVLGAYLVSPGVMGIAIALNLQQIARADGGAVVSAVAAGALVFEVVSAFVSPAEAS
jgi:hypothetical protein